MLAILQWVDLPTSRALIFSQARSASGSFFFYVFPAKASERARERESESSSFALGPTTGTGNEKQRTLRKSKQWAEPPSKVHVSKNGSNTDYDPQDILLHRRMVNKIG